MSSPNLAEVDVEAQLKKAEESGDNESIVLSEKSDDDYDEEDDMDKESNTQDEAEDEMGKESDIEDDDDKYHIGDMVVSTDYFPGKEQQPIYKIKDKNEEGKYLIEQWNVNEGETVSPEKWVKEDEISPQVPDSPDSPAYVPEPSVNPFAVQEEVLPEISSEEDSDDDEYNENMKKLEQDINKDYLYSYHPETKQINYKELLTLSNITRNKKGQIIDPLHKTIPFLTRYEKAKILGLRAKQLNHGAKTLLPQLPRDIIDGHTIAYMELIQKKIPFIIRRPIPNGGSEYWKVNDLKNID